MLKARGRRSLGDRRRVLGDAWLRNLETLIQEEGAVHFVFFNGDAAQSGKPEEYAEVTDFFRALCLELGIGLERLFVVPGNHDIDRGVQAGAWESTRMRLAATTDLLGVSRWMNGISAGAPLGFEDSWKAAIPRTPECLPHVGPGRSGARGTHGPGLPVYRWAAWLGAPDPHRGPGHRVALRR